MDEFYMNTRMTNNSVIFKKSLDRIVDRYSKLQDQNKLIEVDLFSTKIPTIERYMKLSKARLNKLDSKSQVDAEESLRSHDITGDSKLDFTHQDDEAEETCGSSVYTSQFSVEDDAMNTSRSVSHVTVSSLDESLRSLDESQTNPDETWLQPEDQDEQLEMTLSSHDNSFASLYPDVISRLGKTLRRQRIAQAADSVLRRYHRWRWQPNRSHVNNTFNTTLRSTKGDLENSSSREQLREGSGRIKKQFPGAQTTRTGSPLKAVTNLQSPDRTGGSQRRDNQRPILVMDLSEILQSNNVPLDKTFTVSEDPSSEDTSCGEQSCSYSVSPPRPLNPTTYKASPENSLGSRRLYLAQHSPLSNHGFSKSVSHPRERLDVSGSSVRQRERQDVYGSPVRKKERPDSYSSPVRQRERQDHYSSPVRQRERQDVYGSPVRQRERQDVYGSPVRKKERPDSYSSPVRQRERQDVYGSPVRQRERQDVYGSPVRQRERQDVYSSPVRRKVGPYACSPLVRQSPSRAMMGPSRSPNSFSRSPRRYSSARSLSSSLSSPYQKQAVLLRLRNSPDSRPSPCPQLPTAQWDGVSEGRRRHHSFDSFSSLPSSSASCSPKQLDEDFIRLYHKFVCQSKPFLQDRPPCRFCARRPEASRFRSSSSLAALALSPHRSVLRKRHRESDRDDGRHPLQLKRLRDDTEYRCASSPGSRRHSREMLRRHLSTAQSEWFHHSGPSHSPSKRQGVFQRFSDQQHPNDSHQEPWMSQRRRVAEVEFSGPGASLEGRITNGGSPRKRW